MKRRAGVPVVSLHNVTKIYRDSAGQAALSDASLRVDRGDYVSIMGPSGSGKSTLLNMVALLDSPTTGEVVINEVGTSNLKASERASVRREYVSVVFQAFHLLGHLTALENVEMALLYRGIRGAERRNRSGSALERVGLSHRIKARTDTLSGGERQRVAIARAVVSEPQILLCDEPTGNLDSESSTSVLDLIDRIHAGGSTIMVITHDPDVANRARRRCFVRDGVLTES